VSRLQAGWLKSWGSLLGRNRYFFWTCVQTNLGSHTTFYPMGMRGKVMGAWCWTPTSVLEPKLRMSRTIPPVPHRLHIECLKHFAMYISYDFVCYDLFHIFLSCDKIMDPWNVYMYVCTSGMGTAFSPGLWHWLYNILKQSHFLLYPLPTFREPLCFPLQV
jgi:hypothetical protein